MESFDFSSVAMILVFIIGYVFITIEHLTHINKATVALMMAIICWVLEFGSPAALANGHNAEYFSEHLSAISQVIFFLLGALTVVEIISAHKGFDVIADWVRVKSKKQLLWLISVLAFLLSGVLDNLTTTIVMISILRQIIDEGEDRLLLGGAVVIAANAGGAWTPIGDVTTTMLWIGGQLSTVDIVRSLFLPSVACLVLSTFVLSFFMKGNFNPKVLHLDHKRAEPMGRFVFFLGIALLIFVPIFKLLTGLPPFMGMLFAMSVLWIVTDFFHSPHEERNHLRVPQVMTKIDLSGTLFFLGILLCITALDTAGLLKEFAFWLDKYLETPSLIAIFIGFASAVIDNVPLVAASMGMYDLSTFPTDNPFWELIAYCAGTGGSLLIIGSAAGVVYMGLEKVNFFWYLKKISLAALAGYLAGIAVYFLF